MISALNEILGSSWKELNLDKLKFVVHGQLSGTASIQRERERAQRTHKELTKRKLRLGSEICDKIFNKVFAKEISPNETQKTSFFSKDSAGHTLKRIEQKVYLLPRLTNRLTRFMAKKMRKRFEKWLKMLVFLNTQIVWQACVIQAFGSQRRPVEASGVRPINGASLAESVSSIKRPNLINKFDLLCGHSKCDRE